MAKTIRGIQWDQIRSLDYSTGHKVDALFQRTNSYSLTVIIELTATGYTLPHCCELMGIGYKVMEYYMYSKRGNWLRDVLYKARLMRKSMRVERDIHVTKRILSKGT